ncbi:MAG TPA: hypothetical protein VG125_12715 [Pirellulales bacterium]|jgi:hypothetical protein|nr:hypothetical protein [Pirellulales bacterium]
MVDSRDSSVREGCGRSIAASLAKLGHDEVLDGEIVIWTASCGEA